MKDIDKTKEQLLTELADMRKEIKQLKKAAAKQKKDMELNYLLISIFENLSEGVIITDFSSRIIYVNKSIERMSGFSRRELIGKDPKIINGEPGADSIQLEIFTSMLYSERYCKEMLQKRKDGSTYLAGVEIFPVNDGNGLIVAWASVQRDITKRKLLEEALWDSNRRYETLLKALPVGLLHTDTEGMCVYTNELTSGIMDLLPEEMVNYGWVRAIHPEMREKALALLGDILEKREPFKREYRFHRSDGKNVSVLIQAAPHFGQRKKFCDY